MKEEFEEAFNKDEGFIGNNNYHIDEMSEKEVVLSALITKTSMNPYNMAHGGFIFGLGDTAMGSLVRTTGKTGVTLTANINYLRPAIEGKIKAVAHIIKNGNKTCYVEANIYDEKEKIIASMNATYYYVD